MNFISKFCRGLFVRGTNDNCPPNFVTEGNQLMVKGGNIVIRPGLVKYNVAVTKASVNRMSIYQPNPSGGIVTPNLIAQRGFSGNPIHNITLNTTIYLSGATNIYHSWVNFFGRGYFTLHNTLIASATEKVQVYDPSLGVTSRDACALKPVSAMLSASAVGGLLGVGWYLFDVIYITNTGFKTKPSGNVKVVSCFGGYKVDHTVIPTGPAGTAARQIIMTKAINLSLYTGNPNDYEFFFEPNGLINDNVTTTHTTSEYDGNLINSADYLFDNLESIPSGLGIGEYNSRMLVWGERANPSIVRVSKVAEPESFDSIDGIIVVDPSESGGVTNCIVLRGTLYIMKNNRMYYTIDNGQEPSTWEVKSFDAGTGTTCYGASAVLDSRGTHLNQFLIAAKSGLVLFDGLIRTPDLTYYIEDLWKQAILKNPTAMSVCMDPTTKSIFINIQLSDNLYYILYGDYSEGLDSEHIKWFVWLGTIVVPTGLAHVVIFVSGTTGVPELAISDGVGIYSASLYNPTDIDQNHAGADTAITATLRTPVIVNGDDDGNTQQIDTVRIRMRHSIAAAQAITAQAVSNSDPAKSGTTQTFPFVNAINKMQDRWMYLPFVDDEPQIKFTISSLGLPVISRIAISGQEYGESDPQ